MKLAIYARVSTERDQSPEMQLMELREYAAARRWTIVEEYVDAGWSGGRADRPQLERLMAAARKRKFDCVAVWRLDRFGRSLQDLIANIQELTNLGVTFMTLTEGITTEKTNPAAKLLLHIFGAFAEFEKELIRERVACGMKAARAKGKALGRPKRVFRRDEALKLRNAGLSWRAIAEKLGVPLTTVVRACTEMVPAKSPSGR